jgi:hypothetical protein
MEQTNLANGVGLRHCELSLKFKVSCKMHPLQKEIPCFTFASAFMEDYAIVNKWKMTGRANNDTSSFCSAMLII